MEWNRLVPALTVADFAASLQFYTEQIGFAVVFSRTDPAFASLNFEGAQLMLEACHPNGWEVAALAKPYGRGMNLLIQCADVITLRDRLVDFSYPLYREIEETWYDTGETLSGYQEFLVQDPDGYLLRFSQHVGEREKQK